MTPDIFIGAPGRDERGLTQFAEPSPQIEFFCSNIERVLAAHCLPVRAETNTIRASRKGGVLVVKLKPYYDGQKSSQIWFHPDISDELTIAVGRAEVRVAKIDGELCAVLSRWGERKPSYDNIDDYIL